MTRKIFTGKLMIRLCFGIFAIAFITIGIFQGDFDQTWNKAIRVCLECIGIG